MVGNNENYIRIIDRSKAIKYALSIALKGDVVLILGKGRDNYMAIKDKKINYSDYNVIKSFFQKK
jgi:UDP-N-acetylmuramoyl-L-alanyl-D-glutamate--2,6-diaminopimelate ligase